MVSVAPRTDPSLPYSGLTLTRTSPLRELADWQAACRDHQQARILPVWRGRNLVDGWGESRTSAPTAFAPLLASLPSDHFKTSDMVLLGVNNDSPVLAADVSHWSKAQAESLGRSASFVDLRQIGPALGQQDAALLSYARGMVHWHRTHRHCGQCGTAMANERGGMLRRCNDKDCGGVAFPRIDPAIIVLVEDACLHSDGVPRCLLGRAPNWPKGVYSTLAGFVEPGESLEETVVREVLEESGVQVEQPRYQASQPWPFPSSLMLGFHATARSLAITLHDDELEDARWFSAAELQHAGDWGEGGELCLPRQDSIARFLINGWLDTIKGAA